MKRFLSLYAFTVALLFCSLPVVTSLAQTREAQSIRCGTEVVRLRAHSSVMLKKCGAADQKDLIKARLETRETWTSNCGSGRFIRVVTMRGGKVDKIEEGARGSGATHCR